MTLYTSYAAMTVNFAQNNFPPDFDIPVYMNGNGRATLKDDSIAEMDPEDNALLFAAIGGADLLGLVFPNQTGLNITLGEYVNPLTEVARPLTVHSMFWYIFCVVSTTVFLYSAYFLFANGRDMSLVPISILVLEGIISMSLRAITFAGRGPSVAYTYTF